MAISRSFARRRRMPYAAATAALVALGACGAAAPTPPTRSSTHAPPATHRTAPPKTTTLDPVIARIPAAARPETMQGAVEYTRHYFAELNNAFRVANAVDLRQLAKNTCKMCASLARGVDDLATSHKHYGGDLVTVNYVTAMDFTARSQRTLVDLRQNAVPVLNSHGTRVEATRAARLQFVVTLEYRGRWFVIRLQKATS